MSKNNEETKLEGRGRPGAEDKHGKGTKFLRGKRPQRKDPKPEDKKPYLGKNNIEWRTSDPTMTELVARLPFGLASGLSQTYITDEVARTEENFVVPGIMSIRTRLTVGGNNGSNTGYNSAINLAVRKIYSYVRHANSGSKNYEAADLGMYLLALQQALGLLGWIQRLYRIVNEYSITNRYTPVRLMKVMGVDPDDMIANQPQLKYLIAWFGRAIGSLAFPDLRIMHASYEAYKWIIRDSDSPKEQFYIIDSAGFGKYNPTLTTFGGGVTYNTSIAWGSIDTPFTFNQLYNYVHDIMDVLLSDEDCGIISGDILKAYKEGGLFKIEAFGDYDVFIKDDEILQQIHNAHVVPESACKLDDYHQVSGDTGTAPYILPTLTTPASSVSNRRQNCMGQYLFLDAFSKVPDAKEVVNCTVLNPVYDLFFVVGANQVSIDGSKVSFDLHLPVDVVLDTNINVAPSRYTTQFARWYMDDSVSASFIAALTSFDWHPYTMVLKSASSKLSGVHIIGDKQNCRLFTIEVGTRIHENSMLSLMNFTDNNFQ
jgi:hypothetical protein